MSTLLCPEYTPIALANGGTAMYMPLSDSFKIVHPDGTVEWHSIDCYDDYLTDEGYYPVAHTFDYLNAHYPLAIAFF